MQNSNQFESMLKQRMTALQTKISKLNDEIKTERDETTRKKISSEITDTKWEIDGLKTVIVDVLKLSK